MAEEIIIINKTEIKEWAARKKKKNWTTRVARTYGYTDFIMVTEFKKHLTHNSTCNIYFLIFLVFFTCY